MSEENIWFIIMLCCRHLFTRLWGICFLFFLCFSMPRLWYHTHL